MPGALAESQENPGSQAALELDQENIRAMSCAGASLRLIRAGAGIESDLNDARLSEMMQDALTRSGPEITHVQFWVQANARRNLALKLRRDAWVFWYSNRCCCYAGVTLEEISGWSWQSIHLAQGLPEMLRRFPHFLKAGKWFEINFRLKSADGDYRPFFPRAIVACFGANTDVTEQERTRGRPRLMVKELNRCVTNTLVKRIFDREAYAARPQIQLRRAVRKSLAHIFRRAQRSDAKELEPSHGARDDTA